MYPPHRMTSLHACPGPILTTDEFSPNSFASFGPRSYNDGVESVDTASREGESEREQDE